MSKIQSVRGTHDLIGSDLLLYKHIREVISTIADDYDYNPNPNRNYDYHPNRNYNYIPATQK